MTAPAECEWCGEPPESCRCRHCADCLIVEEGCVCPTRCRACEGSGLPATGPIDEGRCSFCKGRGEIERSTP